MRERRTEKRRASLVDTRTTNTIRVLAGEYKTSNAIEDRLITVLGSCVAACVRNPVAGFGGINHFMLPDEAGDHRVERSGFFGQTAMDALLDDVLKSGCRLNDLEVKVFGGADLYRSSVAVGQKNLAFVLNYLEKKRLRPAALDVGGSHARKIVYVPATGVALRRFIAPQEEHR